MFGGDAAAQWVATHQLLAHGALALAGVIVLLYLALRSMRSVTQVLVNLPVALARFRNGPSSPYAKAPVRTGAFGCLTVCRPV